MWESTTLNPPRCHSERSDRQGAQSKNLRFLHQPQLPMVAHSSRFCLSGEQASQTQLKQINSPHAVILSEATRGSEVEEPAVPNPQNIAHRERRIKDSIACKNFSVDYYRQVRLSGVMLSDRISV
jgi:hypothetical protein